MTPAEKIDAVLDSVLRASGSSIKLFRNEIILEGMREAMRKIMSDSYLQGGDDARHVLRKHYEGSNDAQNAMKGK